MLLTPEQVDLLPSEELRPCLRKLLAEFESLLQRVANLEAENKLLQLRAKFAVDKVHAQKSEQAHFEELKSADSRRLPDLISSHFTKHIVPIQRHRRARHGGRSQELTIASSLRERLCQLDLGVAKLHSWSQRPSCA